MVIALCVLEYSTSSSVAQGDMILTQQKVPNSAKTEPSQLSCNQDENVKHVTSHTMTSEQSRQIGAHTRCCSHIHSHFQVRP